MSNFTPESFLHYSHADSIAKKAKIHAEIYPILFGGELSPKDKTLLKHPDYMALANQRISLVMNIVWLTEQIEGCTECFEGVIERLISSQKDLHATDASFNLNHIYTRKLSESLMKFLRARFAEVDIK